MVSGEGNSGQGGVLRRLGRRIARAGWVVVRPVARPILYRGRSFLVGDMAGMLPAVAQTLSDLRAEVDDMRIQQGWARREVADLHGEVKDLRAELAGETHTLRAAAVDLTARAGAIEGRQRDLGRLTGELLATQRLLNAQLADIIAAQRSLEQRMAEAAEAQAALAREQAALGRCVEDSLVTLTVAAVPVEPPARSAALTPAEPALTPPGG